MAGSHAHRGGHTSVDVDPLPKRLLLGLLVLMAVLTVAGVVLLRPDGTQVDALADDVSFAAPGVTFPVAEVVSVEEPCPVDEPPADGCGQVTARVSEGEGSGTTVALDVPPEVLTSSLQPGDSVKLIRAPAQEGQDASFGYLGIVRTAPVGLMLGIFVVVVLAVARWRGLYALVGLAFSAAVIVKFMLPSLLSGHSGVLVGMVGSAAIMFVVLYTTHGWSLRTSAALGGTLAGIGLTGLIGWLSVGGARLTGVADEGARQLGSFATDLSFPGLLTCAVIVAGLGVLNDVTITQASSVWEIRAAAPAMSRRKVFASGMRIGRDHIASTIYTIVFAYAGTALTILLVLSLYDRPFLDLLATEEIGQEVVRTLATSIGLVLAVPLTTAIAVVTLPRAATGVSEYDDSAAHGHGH